MPTNESTMTIEDGHKVWRNKQGQLHRLDGPAVERADGTKKWYRKGQWHRLDGPAVECADGTKYWYQKDQLHRLDGPAIERANGTKEWYRKGQCHRLDGPAIECADGTKEWWTEGKQAQALIFTHENGKLTKKPVKTYAMAYEMMCENLRNEVCSWCEELK